MKAAKHSPTEAEERAKFESWYKATKDFDVGFDGYLHSAYEMWFYKDESVNTAWRGWRERAYQAGSFRSMPGMDPAYKALEDAISACEALIDNFSSMAFEMHNEGVKDCIAAIRRIQQRAD